MAMVNVNSISQEEKSKIAKKLEEKNALKPCPRCGQSSFVLADGYVNEFLQSGFGGIVFGGPTVPSVVVVCNNCGFMSQHALGPLGLLPKQGV